MEEHLGWHRHLAGGQSLENTLSVIVRAPDFPHTGPDDQQMFAIRERSSRARPREVQMPVRIEKSDAVWTVIHSRPETRNAMDPDCAAALYEAFLAFDTDDIRPRGRFLGRRRLLLLRMGPQTCRGPVRRRSSGPVRLPRRRRAAHGRHGTQPAGTLQTGDCRRCRTRGSWRHGTRPVGRYPRDGGDRLHGRLLPSLGHTADRRRHCAPAAPGG